MAGVTFALFFLLAGAAAKEPCGSKGACAISGLDSMDGAEGLGLAQLRARRAEQGGEVQKDVAKKHEEPSTCFATLVPVASGGASGYSTRVTYNDNGDSKKRYCWYTEEGKSKSKVVKCDDCHNEHSKGVPKGSYSQQCSVPLSATEFGGIYSGTCAWPAVALFHCACNAAADCDRFGYGPSNCTVPTSEAEYCQYWGTAQCALQGQAFSFS